MATITGTNNADTLTGNPAQQNTIYGLAGYDELYGGTREDKLYGGVGDDTLDGGDGDDLLDGGTGADTMEGGAGDDTYVVDNLGDVVNETVSGDIDTVQSSISYSLAALNLINNLTLLGSAAKGTGNGQNNIITGNNAANLLDGGSGTDTLIGGFGNDTYIVNTSADVVDENANAGIDEVRSAATFTLPDDVENLALTGAANINATGNVLGNIITGNNGNNRLDGGLGMLVDTLAGGVGSDTYVVYKSTDKVTELAANAGTDEVRSSATYSLVPTAAAGVEKLTLTGAAAIDATGNALANTLTGNSGKNTLDGGTGADTLKGNEGDDTYIVDNLGDTVVEDAGEGNDTVKSSVSFDLTADGANVEKLILTGTANIKGTGNALNNTLTGNSAANLLDGAGGTDTLIGGAGDDTYVVSSAADTVMENSGAGKDTVRSPVSFTLPLNVEILELTGANNASGTGNALGNTLKGNSGNNWLDGGTGVMVDTFQGGAGSDTYIVNVSGDIVTDLAADPAVDEVRSSATYSLAAATGVENLALTGTLTINGTGNALSNTLTGNSGNNTLSGGSGDDTLAGNAGNDTLDGGTGADDLTGGAGDDTYFIDNAGDEVTEFFNQGKDTVKNWVSFTLDANIENLILQGGGGISGIGNALDNTITGNSGANLLDGGSGKDTLAGGDGNDTYVIDNLLDKVTESNPAAAQIDEVRSSVNFTLGSYVERLTLIGAAAINGTGNTLANAITGNIAANLLDGATGADLLAGGDGNDTYIVDNLGDTVTETNAAAAQIDLVKSSVSFTLGADLENLTLTQSGISAVNGTGNGLDNTLIGNNAANTLSGQGGDDSITGGGGGDTLTGGAGADTFYYTLPSDIASPDTITDFSSAQGDKINIAGLDVDPLTSGIQTWSYTRTIGASTPTFTGKAGEITFDPTSHALLFDQTGIGAADLQIKLPTAASLTADDLPGLAAQTVFGSSAGEAVTGWAGIDKLVGKGGADTLTGNGGADTFVYSAATDTGQGAGNRDTIADFTAAQGDKIDIALLDSNSAKAGTQKWSFSRTLGSGAPTFTNKVGEASFDANNHLLKFDRDGNGVMDPTDFEISLPTVASLTVSDFIGLASQTVVGTAAAEAIAGWAGADRLVGKGGADTLTGNGGADTFAYTAASDTGLGAGRDTLTDFSQATGDKIDLSALDANAALAGVQAWSLASTVGSDALTFSGKPGEVSLDTANQLLKFDLDGNNVADFEISLPGVASMGVNDLVGLGSKTLVGTAAADAITGSAKALNGWQGADVIIGGAGADTLAGGTGADTFVYKTAADSGVGAGRDTVTDFSAAQGDKIDVSAVDAKTATAGVLDPWTFVKTPGGNSATFTNTAGEASYDAGTKLLKFDQNGDGVAEFEISLPSASSVAAGDVLGVTAEKVLGTAGADVITGWAGLDTMSGGASADTFIFSSAAETGTGVSNYDTITDFNSTQLDKINVSALDSDVSTAGTQLWQFLGVSTVVTPVPLAPGGMVFDPATNLLSFDQAGVGANGVADFSIKLAGVAALSNSDFILF